MVSSAYLRLLIFLPGILIPACASSSLAFHMMYSAYKLNRQGDNIQPWHTSFAIWNQSVVPCPVLIVAYWPAYRYLRRHERCSGIPISFRIFHTLLWSTQSTQIHTGGFPVAQLVNNLPAIWETWIQSLSWDDILEKGKATLQYSGLENSVDCIVHGVTKSWTWLSDFHSHSQRLWCSQGSRSRCFSGTLLLFLWSKGCWQFNLWFLCLFYIQLKHLEFQGSCTAEAWLREFWALLC